MTGRNSVFNSVVKGNYEVAIEGAGEARMSLRIARADR
jgi:hypothetical protein